jgi:hypothetical protein
VLFFYCLVRRSRERSGSRRRIFAPDAEPPHSSKPSNPAAPICLRLSPSVSLPSPPSCPSSSSCRPSSTSRRRLCSRSPNLGAASVETRARVKEPRLGAAALRRPEPGAAAWRRPKSGAVAWSRQGSSPPDLAAEVARRWVRAGTGE